MNQKMKDEMLDTMARFLENDGDFDLYKQMDILTHLVNTIYVVTEEAKLTPLPDRISLGNMTTTQKPVL
tara:strand:+ start:763 stop:969 length:207 start_codon:yes stop_codon:yes gene_type:complete